MSANQELKPCPFCGGEAHAWERHDQGYSVYGRFWWNAGCKSCLFEMNDREAFDDGKLVYPEKECFERWNTRAEPALIAAAAKAERDWGYEISRDDRGLLTGYLYCDKEFIAKMLPDYVREIITALTASDHTEKLAEALREIKAYSDDPWIIEHATDSLAAYEASKGGAA